MCLSTRCFLCTMLDLISKISHELARKKSTKSLFILPLPNQHVLTTRVDQRMHSFHSSLLLASYCKINTNTFLPLYIVLFSSQHHLILLHIVKKMEVIKDAVNTLIGRKPSGPKVRYAVVGAGSIAQSAFMPGILQTSNSGTIIFVHFLLETI